MLQHVISYHPILMFVLSCNLPVATPTTLLPREQIQSLRHAPHRFGLKDRPGRKTSIAFFSLGGTPFRQ